MSPDDDPPPDEGVPDPALEAREYLQQVLTELRRREELLAKIDAEILIIETKLHETVTSRTLREGSALRITSGESLKSVLRERLKRLKKERAVSAEDVQRALDRKRLVEEELEALGVG
jgi:hypothetical protein